MTAELAEPDAEALLSSPASKAGRIQRALLTQLTVHEQDGQLPTSGRFLFYELVTLGVVAKASAGARRADQDTIDALTFPGTVAWSRGTGSPTRPAS